MLHLGNLVNQGRDEDALQVIADLLGEGWRGRPDPDEGGGSGKLA